MITAETIKCTIPSAAEVKSGAEVVCSGALSTSASGAVDWQAVAAVATVLAVIVAVWQTIRANNEARAANVERQEAQAMLRKQSDDARFRSASRLSVWVEINTNKMPEIHIKNGSEDALYDVTIHHFGLAPLGFATFPIMAPGFSGKITMVKWYLQGPEEGRAITPGMVQVTLTDALGHTYERLPENKGILTEVSEPNN